MSFPISLASDNLDYASVRIEACRALLSSMAALLLNDDQQQAELSPRLLGETFGAIEMLLASAHEALRP